MGLLSKSREKRLERLLCCACFRPLGGREIEEFLIIVKSWTKQLNIPSCISFGIGL